MNRISMAGIDVTSVEHLREIPVPANEIEGCPVGGNPGLPTSVDKDDGVAYLITEYIDGVGMNEITTEQQNTVIQELEKYMESLKQLTSLQWGGPEGLVLPPYRIMKICDGPWHMKNRKESSLVFCHNDLSANNVIVDPSSLKIMAIIDWEYSGFFPLEFERPFYRRPGPSIALPDEVDDVKILLEMMDLEKET